MTRRRRAHGRGRWITLAAAVAAAAVAVSGCGDGGADTAERSDAPAGAPHAPAKASHHVTLQPLNGSGVDGRAVVSRLGSTLSVRLWARGLDPHQRHVQHIHRLPSGERGRCPGRTADTDGDGLVSLDESLVVYGPVAVKLEPFPRADARGSVSFKETFELPAGVEPLADRVVVVYGRDLSGVYDPTVPVACGPVG